MIIKPFEEASVLRREREICVSEAAQEVAELGGEWMGKVVRRSDFQKQHSESRDKTELKPRYVVNSLFESERDISTSALVNIDFREGLMERK